MRKNLTKKLFLSILTLAFAVVSLGASTYAWFILSEDASVQSFSGTVTAGTSGLEIAVGKVDGSDKAGIVWRSTELDLTTDFAEATTVKFDALQNAATFSGSAFTKLDTNVKGEENKNYVAFRLYFRLADATGIPAEGEKVYLTDYDLTTESASAWYVNKNYEGVTGPVTVGQADVIYYVSDAARIAFVAGGTSTVYETDNLAGEANFASHGIGQKGAFSYYNAVSDDAGDLEEPDAYYPTETSLDAAQELVTLTAGANEAYVDVYVWIDGWDQECINAIFTQQLNIALKFSLNDTVQE